MVVHEVQEVGHQFAERELRPEAGHDGQQPRVAAGENPQCLDRLRRPALARHLPPEGRAAAGIQRTQEQHPEEVVEGPAGIVYLVEPAGRARQQDNPGLVLERVAQLPSGIFVRYVPEHHVQVLDEQHQALAFAVREVLQGADTAVPEQPVVPDGPQLLESAPQIGAVVSSRRLIGQARQAFEPEFAGGRDFVALFREDHREEARGEPVVPDYLGFDPQQQARLAAAARPDDDLVRVGVSVAFPERFDDRIEFSGPHAKGRNELVVGQEPRIVFPGGHRPAPPLRHPSSMTGRKLPPQRFRHQSSRSPDVNR